MVKKCICLAMLVMLPLLYTCADPAPQYQNVLQVTATAYTSHPSETDSQPNIAAWGDKLAPGMFVIAVSRDLLKKGLGRYSKVYIAELNQEFVVMDKMNKRWTDKIDIYMGNDIPAAKQWGKQQVTIHWN